MRRSRRNGVMRRSIASTGILLGFSVLPPNSPEIQSQGTTMQKTCSMCDLTSLLTAWYFQTRDLPGKRLLPPQVLNVKPCYVEASKRSSGFSLASPAGPSSCLNWPSRVSSRCTFAKLSIFILQLTNKDLIYLIQMRITSGRIG